MLALFLQCACLRKVCNTFTNDHMQPMILFAVNMLFAENSDVCPAYLSMVLCTLEYVKFHHLQIPQIADKLGVAVLPSNAVAKMSLCEGTYVCRSLPHGIAASPCLAFLAANCAASLGDQSQGSQVKVYITWKDLQCSRWLGKL